MGYKLHRENDTNGIGFVSKNEFTIVKYGHNSRHQQSNNNTTIHNFQPYRLDQIENLDVDKNTNLYTSQDINSKDSIYVINENDEFSQTNKSLIILENFYK